MMMMMNVGLNRNGFGSLDDRSAVPDVTGFNKKQTSQAAAVVVVDPVGKDKK